jgi:serine/threonine-protein kinase
MPDIGDILGGKYRLVSLLGEGGMGTVFLAEHLQLDKKVAVKALRQDLSADPSFAQRFTREAQASGTIGHRSIIDVQDIGSAADGSLYMVMEYLQGQSLGQALKGRRSLDVPFTAYVACQVLSALDAAHGKGIVHRDLKPDNVFLVECGRVLPDVKLLDFGISKVARPRDGDYHLTRTGTMMGTPFYMAPEQAAGSKDLDHRVDVYAMGVMLYECLTGRVPFDAETPFALAIKISAGRFLLPRQINPELPEALEATIVKAMAGERDDRFLSARQMLEALAPYLDDQGAALVSMPRTPLEHAPPGPGPVAAMPPTRRSGPRPTPRTDMTWTKGGGSAAPKGRWKWAIAASVAVVLLGLGITAAAFFFPGDVEPYDGRQPAQARVEPAARPAENPQPSQPAQPTPAPAPIAAPAAARQVTVTLLGVPADARVLVDGAVVEGSTITRQASATPSVVTVEAPGRRPWQQQVPFDRDLTVLIALEPAEVARQPGRPATTTDRAAAQPTPTPPPSTPPSTGRNKTSRFQDDFH